MFQLQLLCACCNATAGTHLAPGGKLFVYGPFKKGGQHTTESNATFDSNLRCSIHKTDHILKLSSTS